MQSECFADKQIPYTDIATSIGEFTVEGDYLAIEEEITKAIKLVNLK